MSTIKTCRSIHILFLLVTFAGFVCAQDIPNSQDHPLISCYPGQTTNTLRAAVLGCGQPPQPISAAAKGPCCRLCSCQ